MGIESDQGGSETALTVAEATEVVTPIDMLASDSLECIVAPAATLAVMVVCSPPIAYATVDRIAKYGINSAIELIVAAQGVMLCAGAVYLYPHAVDVVRTVYRNQQVRHARKLLGE